MLVFNEGPKTETSSRSNIQSSSPQLHIKPCCSPNPFPLTLRSGLLLDPMGFIHPATIRAEPVQSLLISEGCSPQPASPSSGTQYHGLHDPPGVQVCGPHSPYDKVFAIQERKRTSMSVAGPAHHLTQGYQRRQDRRDIHPQSPSYVPDDGCSVAETDQHPCSSGPQALWRIQTINTRELLLGTLWLNLSPELSWKNKRGKEGYSRALQGQVSWFVFKAL